MLRHSLLCAALMAITLLGANGCRSCSSCHDYDPPVANCHCGHCPRCGYSADGCNTGCSSCGCSDCGDGTSSYAQPSEGEMGAPMVEESTSTVPSEHAHPMPQSSSAR